MTGVRLFRCAGCGASFERVQRRGRAPKWCSDRCRKRTLYSIPCVDCGASLNGSDGRGPNAPIRCVVCSARHNGAERKVWTREALVDAIRRWAALHDEPPAFPDWAPARARANNDDERAIRWENDDRWPYATTVVAEFGTWNAGIEAAGFNSRFAGGGDGNQYRRRSVREALL